MNSNYQLKSIGQVFGLLSISAALAACGSNGSTASTSGTPAAVSAPTTSAPTDSIGAPSTTTPASTTATPASTTATPASTLPAATSDSVTLSWSAPDENTNGTALTNLAGYQINYGTSPSALTQQISINTVGVMNYVVSNLNSGTWYFEIIAVNSAGVQSTPTSVVSTTI
jgi:Fibronectin type III domain